MKSESPFGEETNVMKSKADGEGVSGKFTILEDLDKRLQTRKEDAVEKQRRPREMETREVADGKPESLEERQMDCRRHLWSLVSKRRYR